MSADERLERVARALSDSEGRVGRWEHLTPREQAFFLRPADAALTALAQAPGLAEVLRGHEPEAGIHREAYCICRAPIGEYGAEIHDHLEAVVRGWIRGIDIGAVGNYG